MRLALSARYCSRSLPSAISSSSPPATAVSPVRNTVAPNWDSVSSTVARRLQFSPTSVMTPARFPALSTAQLPTATPCRLPRFSTSVLAQLETSRCVTRAASKVRSLRCCRRPSSSRRSRFSSAALSAERSCFSSSAICWRSSSFSC